MIHIFHSLLMQCFPLSIFIFPGKSNSANDNYDSGCHSQLEVDKPWKNPASQHPGKVSLRVSIAAAPWLFLVTFPRGKTLLLPPTWIFRRPVFRFDFFPAFLDHIASNVGACCVFSRSIFPPSSSSFFLLWQEGVLIDVDSWRHLGFFLGGSSTIYVLISDFGEDYPLIFVVLRPIFGNTITKCWNSFQFW